MVFIRRKQGVFSEKNKVSPRTVQKWYYKYLACGENALYTAERKKTNPPLTEMQKNIRWAINRYFYSSRRMSLNGAYEILLLSKYTHSDGSLIEGYPTFYQFRYFYYSHENPIKKAISQQGLSYYCLLYTSRCV